MYKLLLVTEIEAWSTFCSISKLTGGSKIIFEEQLCWYTILNEVDDFLSRIIGILIGLPTDFAYLSLKSIAYWVVGSKIVIDSSGISL